MKYCILMLKVILILESSTSVCLIFLDSILLRDHPKDQSYLMHLVEGKSKLDGKRVRGALSAALCSVHSIPLPTITIWFLANF